MSTQPATPRFFETAPERLSADECAAVIALVRSVRGEPGTDFTELSPESIRACEVHRLKGEPSQLWLFERLMMVARAANRPPAGWDFEIDAVEEIQVAHYRASRADHYDWHLDLGPERGLRRKVSLVVELSDPGHYTGADLEFRLERLVRAPKALGSIAVFPSYLAHRLTRIESGDRWSVVAWASGRRGYR